MRAATGGLLLAEISQCAFGAKEANQAKTGHRNGDDGTDDGGEADVVLCDAVDGSRDDIRPKHETDKLDHDDSPVVLVIKLRDGLLYFAAEATAFLF